MPGFLTTDSWLLQHKRSFWLRNQHLERYYCPKAVAEKGIPLNNFLRLPNLKNFRYQVQALPGGLMPPCFPIRSEYEWIERCLHLPHHE